MMGVLTIERPEGIEQYAISDAGVGLVKDPIYSYILSIYVNTSHGLQMRDDAIYCNVSPSVDISLFFRYFGTLEQYVADVKKALSESSIYYLDHEELHDLSFENVRFVNGNYHMEIKAKSVNLMQPNKILDTKIIIDAEFSYKDERSP